MLPPRVTVLVSIWISLDLQCNGVRQKVGRLFSEHVERLPARALKQRFHGQSKTRPTARSTVHSQSLASSPQRVRICAGFGQRRFLPELCYALSVVHLESVPLREMTRGFPLLLEMFLTEAARRYRRDIPAFDGVMPYAYRTWPAMWSCATSDSALCWD